MKLKIKNKFFILLFGFCIIVNYVRAQTQISCDPIWISTDPSNPINPQKPSASNYFNWMLTPSSHSYTCYPGSTGTPYPIESPFYETSININYHSLVNFANSDFFPQDGWELFKQNLGQYNNCSSFRQNIVVVPYIMLYNKYTGIMRLFGSLTDPSLQNYATVIVHVYEAIPDPTHGLNIGWNASSFLSPHGVLNQPLDQKTTVLNVQVPTKFGNDQNTMFYADFVVGYDPCVCHYPSFYY